ncbi:DUF4913 domain-containing protein [Nocardiopsis ganjiahuensis]|uniref:DUF4913 domain-containing protein n=1 Tax=Nocardiopsis ganjiahuensis TaxID=239984 RepID=UPI001EF9F102|nr:DUF4913 domain-containing protein [Nocardiopsis ganjiahuensis]
MPIHRRKVGPRGSRRWAAEWWCSAEAISRLESLWRSWEHLRLDPATGMSVWWRDHADHHMQILFDPEGPFGSSQDENKAGQPLPCTAPPEGLFPDLRGEGTGLHDGREACARCRERPGTGAEAEQGKGQEGPGGPCSPCQGEETARTPPVGPY